MKKYDDEQLMIDHYGRQSLYERETVFKDDNDFSTVEIKHSDNVEGSDVWITRTSYDCTDEENEKDDVEYKQLYKVSPVIQKSRFILSNGYPVAMLNYIDNDHYRLLCNSAYNHIIYSEHFGRSLTELGHPFLGCGSLGIDIERTSDGFRFFAFGNLVAETSISKAENIERSIFDEYYDYDIKVSVTHDVECIMSFAVFPIHEIIFTPDAYYLKKSSLFEPNPWIDTYDDEIMKLDGAGNDMLYHMLHLELKRLYYSDGDDTLVWGFEPVDPELCLKEPYYAPYDKFSLMRMAPEEIKKLYQTERTRRILLGMDLNKFRDEFSSLMNKDQQIYFDFY